MRERLGSRAIGLWLLVSLVFGGGRTALAQDHERERSCGTMNVHERLLATDPDYRSSRERIERDIQAYQRARLERDGGALRSGVVIIPVVVHVVWNTPAQNISLAQIQSQIAVLNADYRRMNADAGMVPAEFTPVAADARVQFQLAVRDPNCNATDGITRTSTSVKSFSADTDDIKSAATGGADPWPSDRYLNLWVGPRVVAAGVGDLLGYAQFPGGPAATDGVVILHSAFGTSGTALAPFDRGRTATHEIGHWLGLFHTFQDGCAGTAAATCPSAGDRVCDTPPTSGPQFFCPAGTLNSCTETPTDRNDQYMNYMDYVDDACMFMFSAGQSARMDATLYTARSSIVASDALIPPTAPATADLWSQDLAADIGAEPDTVAAAMWISDDVWVRRQNDGVANQEHQNPEYRTAGGSPNYVYVRVRNRACTAAGGGTLNLYWAKASSALSWPAPWDGSVTSPALMGSLIGSQPTGSIPAGGSAILAFPWSPPNPADYASFGADRSHFCLLSRVETSSTPPYGMTFPETTNLEANVRNNNNTVWKNITVVDEVPGTGRYGAVSIGNPGDKESINRLEFTDGGGAPERPIFRAGIVTVDLGKELFQRWLADGAQGKGIELFGDRIRLLGSGSWVGSLRLRPGEVHTVQVRFEGHEQSRPRNEILRLLMSQYEMKTRGRGALIGGEDFVFRFVNRKELQ